MSLTTLSLSPACGTLDRPPRRARDGRISSVSPASGWITAPRRKQERAQTGLTPPPRQRQGSATRVRRRAAAVRAVGGSVAGIVALVIGADSVAGAQGLIRTRNRTRPSRVSEDRVGGSARNTADLQASIVAARTWATTIPGMCAWREFATHRQPENPVFMRVSAPPMARPGLEPGTPRFSVVCSTN